jgi:ankyrin repeat protein
VSDGQELGAREVAYLLEVVELARRGETDQLEAQIQAGISVNLTNDVGDTLLILAAYHAHPETVQMLLRHGGYHSRVNGRGQTALGAAVFRQDRSSVTALLAAGADPLAGPQSAVDVAKFFGLTEMATLFESDSSQPAT